MNTNREDPAVSFEIAAASVVGREHARAGRNNQDGLAVRHEGRSLAAVVCDGCGSSPHSELGASLGARLFAAALAREGAALAGVGGLDAPVLVAALERARRGLLDDLRSLAARLGGETAALVEASFLFTLVGFWITGAGAAVFSLGDGLWALNGVASVVGPFAGNQPPYLGYQLLADAAQRPGGTLTVHALRPAAEVESVLVATDGLAPLCTGEMEIAELWQNPGFFAGADALRRRLWLLARTQSRVDWEARRVRLIHGILDDDATVVVARRRATGGR